MKTISGIEFASEHNGTDVFRLIELAYEQGQKDGHSEQLGTNLAEVGTDCISRQAAIDVVMECYDNDELFEVYEWKLNELPPIQPEIIHCKDCRKHNKKLGFDENYNITYRDDACPLIPWRGMSKGHEHDYQSCCLGEKREVTT